mmetsp:Transcript_64116/g.138809  ORF Transcript_64116/g.138809 Transcript_64116/m.138809 type:complete len:643 (-) Transcript_64116:132-2060(-)
MPLHDLPQRGVPRHAALAAVLLPLPEGVRSVGLQHPVAEVAGHPEDQQQRRQQRRAGPGGGHGRALRQRLARLAVPRGRGVVLRHEPHPLGEAGAQRRRALAVLGRSEDVLQLLELLQLQRHTLFRCALRFAEAALPQAPVAGRDHRRRLPRHVLLLGHLVHPHQGLVVLVRAHALLGELPAALQLREALLVGEQGAARRLRLEAALQHEAALGRAGLGRALEAPARLGQVAAHAAGALEVEEAHVHVLVARGVRPQELPVPDLAQAGGALAVGLDAARGLERLDPDPAVEERVLGYRLPVYIPGLRQVHVVQEGEAAQPLTELGARVLLLLQQGLDHLQRGRVRLVVLLQVLPVLPRGQVPGVLVVVEEARAARALVQPQPELQPVEDASLLELRQVERHHPVVELPVAERHLLELLQQLLLLDLLRRRRVLGQGLEHRRGLLLGPAADVHAQLQGVRRARCGDRQRHRLRQALQHQGDVVLYDDVGVDVDGALDAREEAPQEDAVERRLDRRPGAVVLRAAVARELLGSLPDLGDRARIHADERGFGLPRGPAARLEPPGDLDGVARRCHGDQHGAGGGPHGRGNGGPGAGEVAGAVEGQDHRARARRRAGRGEVVKDLAAVARGRDLAHPGRVGRRGGA